MKKSIIFLLLLLPYFATSQNLFLKDSYVLHRVIPDDTNKVKYFDSLSTLYWHIDPDSGIIFAEQALNLAQKLNWQKGIAVANYDLGVNYQAKADYYSSLHHCMKALVIYQKLGRKRSVAAVLSNIAMTYQSQGNYTKALEYHLKALNDMENLGDKKSQAIIMESIGTLHKEQNDYERALEYYNAAFKINEALNDTSGLARGYVNRGIVYDAQGQYKKALESHLAALAVNEQINYKFGMQINMANLGIVYLHLGDLEKSLAYHLKALRLSKEINNQSSIAVNLGNVGETYLTIAKKQGGRSNNLSLANAVKYLEQAVELCREIRFLAPTTEFIPYLTEGYAMSGNFQKAYKYQKLYSVIKDSLFSVDSKIKITNLETGRKIALKEKDLKLKEQQIKIVELQLSKKRDTQGLYLMGILLLILVLGITIKSIISYEKSNKLLTREKKLHTNTILDQYAKLNERNKILEEIAHRQSHDIRGHVATILGLSFLFNRQDYADPQNKNIIEGIFESANSLDEVIREIVGKKAN